MWFKKLKWSKWYDLSQGKFDNEFYVLQARRRDDGYIQYRVEASRKAWGCPTIEMQDLEKVK